MERVINPYALQDFINDNDLSYYYISKHTGLTLYQIEKMAQQPDKQRLDNLKTVTPFLESINYKFYIDEYRGENN